MRPVTLRFDLLPWDLKWICMNKPPISRPNMIAFQWKLTEILAKRWCDRTERKFINLTCDLMVWPLTLKLKINLYEHLTNISTKYDWLPMKTCWGISKKVMTEPNRTKPNRTEQKKNKEKKPKGNSICEKLNILSHNDEESLLKTAEAGKHCRIYVYYIYCIIPNSVRVESLPCAFIGILLFSASFSFLKHVYPVKLSQILPKLLDLLVWNTFCILFRLDYVRIPKFYQYFPLHQYCCA